MSYTTYNSNYHAIKGWRLKIVEIVDDSRPGQPVGSDIAGEGYLMLNWDTDNFTFHGQTFSRKVYICTVDAGVCHSLFHDIEPDDVLFVTGDLSHRNHFSDYPHLRTTLWIDEFIKDKSGGKIHPLAAGLTCSSNELYGQIADFRYADYCVTCGTETAKVPEGEERFCPSCER